MVSREWVSAIHAFEEDAEQVFGDVVDWADKNGFECGLRYYMNWCARPGAQPGHRLERAFVLIAIFENPNQQLLFEIQWGDRKTEPVKDWRNTRTHLVRLDRDY